MEDNKKPTKRPEIDWNSIPEECSVMTETAYGGDYGDVINKKTKINK